MDFEDVNLLSAGFKNTGLLNAELINASVICAGFISTYLNKRWFSGLN